MVTININGKNIQVKEKVTIFNAAQTAGIKIPHLCYHKHLPVWGGCRICVVEVEGAKSLVASCTYPVAEGMKIRTESDELTTARRTILELLMSNHPHDCLTCDRNGNCVLQNYCYQYSVDINKYSGEKSKHLLDKTNPFIIRDYTRCILCGRCVQSCTDIVGANAIDFAYRGFKTKVATPYEIPLPETNCVFCGNCINVCPVGALREVQSENKGRTWEFKKTLTICPYCGVGCNLEVWTKENKIYKITSPSENKVNKGWLCIKGKFGFEFVNHPDRLKTPLVRKDVLEQFNNSLTGSDVVRGFILANGEATLKGRTTNDNNSPLINGTKNRFVPVSWDAALNIIAKKMQMIKQQSGADTIAGLSSAKCSNEDNFVFQKFIRAVIETNNVDHCARLCHAPSVVALGMALGSGAMTNSLSEIENISDVIFIIGNNTAETHPVTSYKIRHAVKTRNAKLIIADPREVGLVDIANVWIQHHPGSDVALINAMAKIIVDEKLINTDFIYSRTEGYAELKKYLETISLDQCCKITGVSLEKIHIAAEMYAKGKASVIIWGMGITQHITGTDNCLALTNLALLTGQIGRPGAGLNPLRGQNNVQGACDMGCLPNVFPGYKSVTDESTRQKFEQYWNKKLSNTPGLTATEMFDGINDGKIKAMYIMGENPAVSDPDSEHVQQMLDKLEFLVVQDIFLTETAQHADVVLPACSFAEKEGTVTNTERRVQWFNKIINPVGDSKPDWEIISLLAKKMDNNKFAYSSVSEIMDEISKLTQIYGGISCDRLKQCGCVQWPCPEINHPGTETLHTEKFTRGLGKFHKVEYIPPDEVIDTEYPLVLTTGRWLYEYHTRTMTGRVEGITQLTPGCQIWIHPSDAKKYKIVDGKNVKVTSRRGTITARSKITRRTLPGVVFLPFHYAEHAANVLTNPVVDKVSKIPEFKVCAVKIENNGE